jgi:hypothetical protein
VNLLVEEIVHNDVPVNASSHIHLINFSLLEVGVKGDFESHIDRGLSLVDLEAIVPGSEEGERFFDVVSVSISLRF